MTRANPLAGSQGVVLKSPTRSEEGYGGVLAGIAGLVRRVMGEGGVTLHQVGAVGLGLPGRLNPAQGMVEVLPNLVGNWIGVQAGIFFHLF